MPLRPRTPTSAPHRSEWTRRHFLGASAAAATATLALPWRSFALDPVSSGHPVTPPLGASAPGAAGGIIARPAGRPIPLLESNVARPLRYTLADSGFRIRNGGERFNRPLYGTLHDGFRVDAGDLPEFQLALPAHGGTLRLALQRADSAPRSLTELADILALYRDGRMLYELRDEALLGRSAELHLEVLTLGDTSGLHLALTGRRLPPRLTLLWAFAGATGRTASPAPELLLGAESRHFDLRPEDCATHTYTLHNAAADLTTSAGDFQLTFPPGAKLHLASAADWRNGWPAFGTQASPDSSPVLAGSLALGTGDEPQHLIIRLAGRATAPGVSLGSAPAPSPAEALAARRAQLTTLAGRLRTGTPEPWLDAAVRASNIAADALWSAPGRSVVAAAAVDRDPAPGWATPMALDAMGNHARVRDHLRTWIARQNTGPLPPGTDPDGPVAGPADPGSALTRKCILLHTNGDLGVEDSDQNLGFFEVLVRHLRWTGDLAFAREAWPALLRHMDWQYRLFRREFADPAHPNGAAPTLPLYESYGSLSPSDRQPGNGAGLAHSSARNLFLNRAAATIARVLNEDATPFDDEATRIHIAMLALLWQSDRGCFAEAKDTLFPQTLSPTPSLATTTRIVDAEGVTAREAWQITASQLAALGRIPVRGEGIPVRGEGVPERPGEAPFLLRSSDWLLTGDPAQSSAAGAPGIDLAGNLHMALSLWQSNQPDTAFALLRGCLIDSTARGLVPGNLHHTSALDPLSGETGIDHGDSLGLFARAVAEGLFGVLPDLLRATLTIRPGFPTGWNDAEFHHPDLDLVWTRDGLHETFRITSRLPHPVALTLLLPALTTAVPAVLANGAAFPSHFDPNSTGRPRLVLTDFPAATEWTIEIRWHGRPPLPTPEPALLHVGEAITLPGNTMLAQVDDPQGCLSNGAAGKPGHHAVFLRIVEEKCGYWLPIPLEILPATPSALTSSADPVHFEPVALGSALNSHMTDLFSRSYTAPRSPLCSLALPEHLLGPLQDQSPAIDDAGLRAASGTLLSAGIPFLTPLKPADPNCCFLSFWDQDRNAIELTLSGRATALHLLMTGTTFPRVSHALHGSVQVRYTDGSESRLSLTPAQNWWPVETDLFLDDFVFRAGTGHPLPPRVDLRTGATRILDPSTFKGQGRPAPGGAATVLHLRLDPTRTLASLRIECQLYGVVLALLAATLSRPTATLTRSAG